MSWLRATARSGLRRFTKSDSGVTAIEFAFVGGPFLYLLGCIFETGLMLFSEYVIENGVAQAARMIRTGQVQTQNISKAQFKQEVCGNLAAFFDCTNDLFIDVRSFTAFNTINLPPSIKNGEVSDDVSAKSSFKPGGPVCVVVVRAYYEWNLFMPGISHLANLSRDRRLLTSGAVFRNEPYAPSGAPC